MDKMEKFDFSKPDILLFGFQVALIFITVGVRLLDLTFQWGNLNLWTVILAGSMGFIMPNPKLKAGIERIGNDSESSNENS